MGGGSTAAPAGVPDDDGYMEKLKKRQKKSMKLFERELRELRRAIASAPGKDCQTAELKDRVMHLEYLRGCVLRGEKLLYRTIRSRTEELTTEAEKLLQEEKARKLERRVPKDEAHLNAVALAAEKDSRTAELRMGKQKKKVMENRKRAEEEDPKRKAIEDRIRDSKGLASSYYACVYEVEKKGHASLLPPDAPERDKANAEAMDRIFQYDPKVGYPRYTRIHFVDLTTFDLDEESPVGPMRDTEAPIHLLYGNVCKEDNPSDCTITYPGAREGRFLPCNSANIFSVKIVSSDVGFPINVYGTVIARDSLDLKCVYLFNRDRDDCQLILSKDESLVLTGPKRGLALEGAIYFEVDLKIKGGRKRKDDVQLSKGYEILDGVPRNTDDENEIERYDLETMLSKVVLTCAVEKRAVEATISIEVIQGKFHGDITVRTTSVKDSILLHDSKMAPDWTGKGVVLLLRRVVAVSLKEKLILTAARVGSAKGTIKFSPKVSGSDEKEMVCGFVKMRVNVSWSIISRLYLN